MKNAALKRLVEKEVNSYIKFLDDRSNIFYLATNSAGKLVKETNFDNLIKKCLDVLAQKSELIVTRMINGKVGKVMKVTKSDLKPNLRGALNNLKIKSATTNKNKQLKKEEAKEKEINSFTPKTTAERGVKGVRSGKYYSEQMEREKRQTENAKASRLPARGKKTGETTVLGLKAIKPNNEFSALRANERKRQVPTEYAERAHERELKAQKEIERQNEKEAERQAKAGSKIANRAEEYGQREAEKILKRALTSRNTMDPIWTRVSNLKTLDPTLAKLKKQANEHFKKIVAAQKAQKYKETHSVPELKRSFPNAYLGTQKTPLTPEERAEARAGKKLEKIEAKKARRALNKQKMLVGKSRGVAEKIKNAKDIGKKKFSVAERNPKARKRMSKYVPPENKYAYKGFEKPKTKEQQREETQRLTNEFLRKGNKIKRVKGKTKDTYAMVLRKRRNRREDARISRLNDMMFYQYIMRPRAHRDMFPAVIIGIVLKLIPIIKAALLSQIGGMIAKRLLNHCMKLVRSGSQETITGSLVDLIKSDSIRFVNQLKKEGSYLAGNAQTLVDKLKALRAS